MTQTLSITVAQSFQIHQMHYASNRKNSTRDLLLNEKQKKPFVWLNDEVTITQ